MEIESAPLLASDNENENESSFIGFGHSLQQLFKLPEDFVKRSENSDRDMELVSLYAEEIQTEAGIDPDVAYGNALLFDPNDY